MGGNCLLIDGLPCTVASQCASNVCAPWYKDRDGDGYGAGTVAGACGNAPPIGYVATTGDCCDDEANVNTARLIHPGADFQSNSADGLCGITWDFNCDGRIETNPLTCSDCTLGDCKCVYTDYPESSCGQPINFYPDDCYVNATLGGCSVATYYSSSAVNCR
jgi:hypothetical protein